MQTVKTINVTEMRQLIQDSRIALVDIRDSASYHADHIEGALLLDQTSIDQFLASADRTQPVVVYCYHGISSQSAAQYLAEQGFTSVYSLSGGFEAWKIDSD